MCCGRRRGDVYDLVVIADHESAVAAAFADAFIARDRRERVAVVLPGTTNTRRLNDYLDLSEITLVRGAAEYAKVRAGAFRGKQTARSEVFSRLPRLVVQLTFSCAVDAPTMRPRSGRHQ